MTTPADVCRAILAIGHDFALLSDAELIARWFALERMARQALGITDAPTKEDTNAN